MNKLEKYLNEQLVNLDCYFEVQYTDMFYDISVYNNKRNYICSLLSDINTPFNVIVQKVYDMVNSKIHENEFTNSINYICDFNKEYFFLNNNYPVTINYNGLTYKCVQSAFEASKETSKLAKMPYTTMDGYTAMSYPTNKLCSDWTDKQDTIMFDLLKIKFSNKELKEKLLNTKDSYIEYVNDWHDSYWGVCKCERCFNNNQNKLGKMLMKIREYINEKYDYDTPKRLENRKSHVRCMLRNAGYNVRDGIKVRKNDALS